MSGLDCSPADYSIEALGKDPNFGERVQCKCLVGFYVIMY
jgi:hypothetical protein